MLLKFIARTGVSLALAASGWAATITLDATTTGAYHSNGTFTIAGNYAIGWYPSASPPGELRDYFVFDLSSVTGTIVGATLRAQDPATGYSSPDGSETFALFDVSTPLSTLISNAGSTTVFADLGTGAGYGSTTVSSAGTTVQVALNSAGLAYLNSAIGNSVALGGALTSINYANATASERLFNNSNATLTRQLVLTTVDNAQVPEPSTFALAGVCGAALILLRRRA